MGLRGRRSGGGVPGGVRVQSRFELRGRARQFHVCHVETHRLTHTCVVNVRRRSRACRCCHAGQGCGWIPCLRSFPQEGSKPGRPSIPHPSSMTWCERLPGRLRGARCKARIVARPFSARPTCHDAAAPSICRRHTYQRALRLASGVSARSADEIFDFSGGNLRDSRLSASKSTDGE